MTRAPQPRLLIVEDDETLADVLEQAFAQRGFEVTVAPGADAALQTFQQSRADVVLTDKNLPGGTSALASGVELVRELRKLDAAVGIIMMTAYGTLESARETLNLGVDEYIEKPFDSIFAVVDHVRALADRAIARRAAAAAPVSAGGPLTILVAASAERWPAIEKWLDAARDRIVHVANPDEIKPHAKSERAALVILDGGSYPLEITALVTEIKTRVRTASCVVLSEHVMLSDVKRLIELEVKALIDDPITHERGGQKLAAAVERIRKLR
jgi:DNA-binding NtrC family response regulator